jgi:glycosyltransferase involved in cell wall biosynthesis
MKNYRILFLGETYRADAISWIKGIENASGCKLDTLEISWSFNRLIRILKSSIFFAKILYLRFFRPKYDFVLAERATSYGFFSLFVNASIRVVAQQGITDIYPNKGFSKFFKTILQNIVYRNVDLIHAWGNAMVYAQLKSGAAPYKIMVRPKGLDLDKFKFQNHYDEKVKLKGIVTRSLEKDYHHSDLIEAVKLLKEKGIIFHLLIIGGGSLLKEMEKLTNSYNLSEEITFKGRINNEELPQYLRECPFYLSVPISEGVSSSLFEAMAAGCLPIITDLPGNRAFIHSGQNGELVEVANPVSIANSIEKAIQSFGNYQKGIDSNRAYIDKLVNHTNNMQYIYKRYLDLLSKKK